MKFLVEIKISFGKDGRAKNKERGKEIKERKRGKEKR